jgi:hypothetical protein
MLLDGQGGNPLAPEEPNVYRSSRNPRTFVSAERDPAAMREISLRFAPPGEEESFGGRLVPYTLRRVYLWDEETS